VLIHLLDGLSEDPVADFTQINSELALFDEALGEKEQVVALNKADLPFVKERWPEVEAALKKHGVKPMLISAVSGENVRKLLYRAAEVLSSLPEPEPVVEMPVYRPETDPEEFSIERSDEGWRVIGVAIERAAAMTYWEYDQSVRRFQRILEALGIEQALRDDGIKQGDTVLIGDFELEWED
jgi:GTP-binding protein